MDVKRHLTLNEIEYLLDFIKQRTNFEGLLSEKIIVEKQKNKLKQQLEQCLIPENFNLDKLKNILKNKHYEALISPGECVGIAGAQAMGEFSTQATLNTFHIAGFETGSVVTTGVSRFQEIINASKNQKNVSCIVFFKNKYETVYDLKKDLNHSVVGVYFKDLISNMYILENQIWYSWYMPCHIIFSSQISEIEITSYEIFRYIIDKQFLFKYFLHPSVIKQVLETQFRNILCFFTPFVKRGRFYFDILIPKSESMVTIRDLYIPKIENTLICGLPSATALITHYDKNEWFIEIEGGSIRDVCTLENIDTTRIISNSVWDIYNTFGIEAAKQFLLDELSKIMHGVGLHNISLLVDRMTFTGTISSITRYTMRNEEGPMGKASFEESMETFIKAAKYGEYDNFTGISAAIIGGKKPRVGTNSFDIRMDLDKINK